MIDSLLQKLQMRHEEFSFNCLMKCQTDSMFILLRNTKIVLYYHIF